jgi:hypothetical protein
MHIYTEPAAHGKSEQGAPSEYLDFLVPIAGHDVLARARELLDISDAEPPRDREWWAVEAVRRGSDWPSVLALQADVIASCGLICDDIGRSA